MHLVCGQIYWLSCSSHASFLFSPSFKLSSLQRLHRVLCGRHAQLLLHHLLDTLALSLLGCSPKLLTRLRALERISSLMVCMRSTHANISFVKAKYGCNVLSWFV